MRYLRGFLYFWYDFIIGDAWEVAVGVVATLVIIAVLVRGQPSLAGALGIPLVLAVVALVGVSLVRETARK